jgi:hypothetical protein
MCVQIVSLYCSGSGVPDLHRHIFGACDHPLPLTVECDSSNVIGMALKGHDRVWIGGLDIVESDDMATRSSEEFLVRGYAKAVHL